MSIAVHSFALGALSLAVASASHAGVRLPAPEAPAQSGAYLEWTGEVISNSFTSGPFASGDWSIGSSVDFFAILLTYDVLEEDALAESFVIAAHFYGDEADYGLTEDVPYLFGNDNPGDSITWSAEFLTGEAFTLDLHDEDGDVFDDLVQDDFLIDGAEFEVNLAQIVGSDGAIEIDVTSIRRTIPGSGAWCLLTLVLATRRRRQ